MNKNEQKKSTNLFTQTAHKPVLKIHNLCARASMRKKKFVEKCNVLYATLRDIFFSARRELLSMRGCIKYVCFT